jgi:hypothetical protein
MEAPYEARPVSTISIRLTPSESSEAMVVHRVSKVTAGGCFETVADARGREKRLLSADPLRSRSVSMIPKLLVAGSRRTLQSLRDLTVLFPESCAVLFGHDPNPELQALEGDAVQTSGAAERRAFPPRKETKAAVGR